MSLYMPADAQRQARSPEATLQLKDRDTISAPTRFSVA
jgi:hypothetical protein